ncbi:MAG: PSD1 and planctomycete cytochrome C domain-containing protein [Planctomycetota bacterium]
MNSEQMKKMLLTLTSALLMMPTVTSAQQLSQAELEFFESNIRPALVKYCYECHSVESGVTRAGLNVDTKRALLEGGDHGPAIVPGDLDESLLWEAINWEGDEMPPSEPMPDEIIENFRVWIEMGAPDPRVQAIQTFNTRISADDIEQVRQQHWAYRKPEWKRGLTIDSIVSERLEEEGLSPATQTDALTLLRRLNYDLVGLPPAPDEIVEFQRQWERDADQAIENKVDELLARPQYGERWGRHWLDVARYAESAGSYNVVFPHAWRYRNYVIDAFNDDTPYNRFLTEQIAGDLLPAETDEQWQENLIATGFLAIGLKHVNERNPRKFTADMVDEQIDTLTQAVLGTTVACARCHDHKTDPIPTGDYYAMAGIMRSTETFYGTQRLAQAHRPSSLLVLPIPDIAREGDQTIEELQNRLVQIREQMAAMGGRRQATADGKNLEFKALARNEDRIEGELATLNDDGTKISVAMGVQEADEMVNASILLGGEVDQPAQEVQRGFLQVFGDLNFEVRDRDSSGRRELVMSIISRENPLTSRVMVNRIWMHLLGRPIVGTPNNFGLSGLEPDNQELLDHLAIRFMQHDWSIKKMIREIVLSDTYQRSSRYDVENYAVDPENKFLWRANTRTLDAESHRDSLLCFSGLMESQRPSGSPVLDAGDEKFERSGLERIIDADNVERSVYLPIIRDELHQSLQLFDFPDANVTSAGRSESIVPTQALYMMNGDFVTAQSQAMALSLIRQFRTTEEQIQNAFLYVYGRPASDEEMEASVQFFRDFVPSQISAQPPEAQETPRRRGQRNNSGNQGRRGGRRENNGADETGRQITGTHVQTLAVFCQTLMSSSEFRILD